MSMAHRHLINIHANRGMRVVFLGACRMMLAPTGDLTAVAEPLASARGSMRYFLK